MVDDKVIKKEVLLLILGITILFLIVCSFSYAYFMSVDKGEYSVINVGDLNISFCDDESCNKKYPNYGKVIGLKEESGVSVVDNVYPYNASETALLKEPYIFNIKNSGKLNTNVTIYLSEDKDYKAKEEYSYYKRLSNNFSDTINIGISNCTNQIDRVNVNILNYSQLIDNIILDSEPFASNEDKTFCLWTWLNENSSNDVQKSYFVANLDFKAEYIPD